MNIEQIINKVDKLDIVEFNKFKEWLQQHGIDEKNNFAKGLIKFVKNELKKRDKDNVENEGSDHSDAIITVDDEGDTEFKDPNTFKELGTECKEGDTLKELDAESKESDTEFKDLIDYLLRNKEEGNIFRTIEDEKDEKKGVQWLIDYFKWVIRSEEDKKDEDKKEENEWKAIQLLIDYFMYKWNKEIRNLKFMLVVSNLLPYLSARSRKISIDELIPKLDYVEVPKIEFTSTRLTHESRSTHESTSTCSTFEPTSTSLTRKVSLTRKHFTTRKFPSNREKLWTYEFPRIKSSEPSKFSKSLGNCLDRFEVDSQHYAIMCYAPLTGLCTYPENSNRLFPSGLSPFAKVSYDTFDNSSKIYESSFFRALVKFKWHAFARWRLLAIFLFYLINSVLFTVVTTMNAKTIENRIKLMSTTEAVNTVAISAININTILTITSIILGSIQILFFFRSLIIFRINRISISGSHVFISVIPASYVTTEILEVLSLFLLRTDFQEQSFHDHVWYILNILPYFRCVSIFITWIGTFVFLCMLKNFGLFTIVIVRICREALRILFLLFTIILATTYATMFLFIEIKPDSGESSTFEDFGKSLQNIWIGSISSNYDFLKPWGNNIFIRLVIFTFSIFTTIIVVNLLIAFVNNVYERVSERLDTVWNLMRAQFIVFIELACLSPSDRKNINYFPLNIMYEAYAEEVEEHAKIEKYTREVKYHAKKVKHHTKKVEECTKKVEEYAKKVEEYAKEVEEYTKEVEEHVKKVRKHVKKVEEHAKEVEGHAKEVEEYAKKLERRAKEVEEVEEHVKKVEERSRKVEESAQLKYAQLKKMLKKLKDAQKLKSTGISV